MRIAEASNGAVRWRVPEHDKPSVSIIICIKNYQY